MGHKYPFAAQLEQWDGRNYISMTLDFLPFIPFLHSQTYFETDLSYNASVTCRCFMSRAISDHTVWSSHYIGNKAYAQEICIV